MNLQSQISLATRVLRHAHTRARARGEESCANKLRTARSRNIDPPRRPPLHRGAAIIDASYVRSYRGSS